MVHYSVPRLVSAGSDLAVRVLLAELLQQGCRKGSHPCRTTGRAGD